MCFDRLSSFINCQRLHISYSTKLYDMFEREPDLKTYSDISLTIMFLLVSLYLDKQFVVYFLLFTTRFMMNKLFKMDVKKMKVPLLKCVKP